jgi:carboxyl-terminal processing protease
VLIDQASASASEIVSGSLQDLDRAVIVGTRSFGKGLVQRPKPLTYGTQLKITISRYYTPSGRCIQALDYRNRDEKGNAIRTTQDSYNAFKTKNGRTVYDGGGIQPDVELPDTKHANSTKTLLKESFIFDYATQYYYANKVEDLSDFKFTDEDFNDFKTYLRNNNFSFETQTEKALKKAMQYAEDEDFKSGLNASYSELMQQLNSLKSQAVDDNKNQIKSLLEYEIIKRYFYIEGKYEYILKHNKAIIEAKNILSQQQKYQSYLNH